MTTPSEPSIRGLSSVGLTDWPQLHATPEVRPATWDRTFPGHAQEVWEVRRFITACLGDCPTADDVLICMSELAANAVVHSNSRLPGGAFTVRASKSQLGRIRVEITDQGGPWSPTTVTDDQRGRGLAIVASLAAAWGINGQDDGRTAWFELDCP
jgi:serine/threonine-protein kinase RsbW